MTIGPIRPALVSATSSVCEWYIQSTEEPSIGPGPARSGTSQFRCTSSPAAPRRHPCRAPRCRPCTARPRVLGRRRRAGGSTSGSARCCLKTTRIVSPTSARITGPSMPRCRPTVGARGLRDGEGRIGVLAVERLPVRARPGWALLGEHLLVVGERLAGDVVDASGCVVPEHLVSCDVVRPLDPGARCSRLGQCGAVLMLVLQPGRRRRSTGCDQQRGSPGQQHPPLRTHVCRSPLGCAIPVCTVGAQRVGVAEPERAVIQASCDVQFERRRRSEQRRRPRPEVRAGCERPGPGSPGRGPAARPDPAVRRRHAAPGRRTGRRPVAGGSRAAARSGPGAPRR